MQILDELYAIHAKGIVHFWVADETDMVSMKKPLQVFLHVDLTRLTLHRILIIK
jgi:hypothetical protein